MSSLDRRIHPRVDVLAAELGDPRGTPRPRCRANSVIRARITRLGDRLALNWVHTLEEVCAMNKILVTLAAVAMSAAFALRRGTDGLGQ